MKILNPPLVFLFCLVLTLPTFPASYQNQGGGNVLSPKTTAFLETSIKFREKALDDYKEALNLYANSQVKTDFEGFDSRLWVYTNPYLGWSSFFTLSILTTFREDEANPLLVFYNPICDIYLVTVWEWGTYVVKMVDADMIMGDWIRSGLNEPFSTWPLWHRGNLFKPLELGNAAGLSVLALEKLIKDNPGSAWPALLPQANSPAVKEMNIAGIKMLVFNFFRNIHEFLVPEEGEDPRLVSVRRQLNEAIDKAGAGDLVGVMDQASETPHETRQVIDGILKGSGPFLPVPASLLTGSNEIFVLMALARHPGVVLSFQFKGDEASVTLKRIDLVDYRAYHEYWARETAQVGGMTEPTPTPPTPKVGSHPSGAVGGVRASPKPRGIVPIFVGLGAAILVLLAVVLVLVSRRNSQDKEAIGFLDVFYSDGGQKQMPFQNKKISIGRDMSNTLVINDIEASGLHAEITPSLHGWILKDMGSTNGTYVNGHRITEAEIKFGDEIKIGDTRVILRGEG